MALEQWTIKPLLEGKIDVTDSKSEQNSAYFSKSFKMRLKRIKSKSNMRLAEILTSEIFFYCGKLR